MISDFPARVRAARKARGWTQRQLAAATGISVRSVTSFESRHTMLQPAHAQAVAEALGITLDAAPANGDAAIAAATRSQWPDDVVVYADVLSQWLSTLSDEERRVVMGDLFRWIMDRRQGNQSTS